MSSPVRRPRHTDGRHTNTGCRLGSDGQRRQCHRSPEDGRGVRLGHARAAAGQLVSTRPQRGDQAPLEVVARWIAYRLPYARQYQWIYRVVAGILTDVTSVLPPDIARPGPVRRGRAFQPASSRGQRAIRCAACSPSATRPRLLGPNGLIPAIYFGLIGASHRPMRDYELSGASAFCRFCDGNAIPA